MSNGTVTISSDVISEILSSLKNLKKDVADIKTRLSGVPSYGSPAWWEHSDNQAKTDIRKKQYTVLKTSKDIDTYFSSL